MADNDFIELGDTDLVPQEHGWFLNKRTGEKIDPHGRIYDKFGELIFEPSEIEGGEVYPFGLIDKDEYEWYNDEDR